MAGSGRDGGKRKRRKAGKAPGKSLVKREEPGLAPPRKGRTKKELARFTDDVVDAINLALREGALKNELIADLLVKGCFDNLSTPALDPEAHPTPEYEAVALRAGGVLLLDASQLTRFTRIGALKQRYRDKTWINLDWALKVELLPLAPTKGDADDSQFRRGLAFANRLHVGVRGLRKFVQDERPQLEGMSGPKRGLTISGGTKLVETGVRLGREEERRAFAERVRKVPAEKRRAFMQDLRATVENLKRLIDEIEGG